MNPLIICVFDTEQCATLICGLFSNQMNNFYYSCCHSRESLTARTSDRTSKIKHVTAKSRKLMTSKLQILVSFYHFQLVQLKFNRLLYLDILR